MENVKVFISYKRIDGQPPQVAKTMKAFLQDDCGFDVFLDVETIPSASEWAKVVLDHIRLSDVVILLIAPNIGKSNWIQREIDAARGSNISVLPLIVSDDIDRIELVDALKRLALENIQHVKFAGDSDAFSKLKKDVIRLAKVTRDNQQNWIEELNFRRKNRLFDSVVEAYKAYKLRQFDGDCNLVISLGDLTRIRSIDVIVNSENNYMQMSQFFKHNSLSSSLRYKGSQIVGGNVWDDSVQRELDVQITHSREIPFRPVNLGQVIVTTGGHEMSNLVQQGYRYIFHVSSVSIQMGDNRVPLTDDGIVFAVENCLKAVIETNIKRGVTSFDPAIEEKQQHAIETYTPIESIIFPLLGTGQAGKPTIEVVPYILKGISMFLNDHKDDPSMTLKRIHLAVFSQSDLPYVEASINDLFDPIDLQ